MEISSLDSAPPGADNEVAHGAIDSDAHDEEPFQLSDSWSLISSGDRERKYYASVELNSADDQPCEEVGLDAGFPSSCPDDRWGAEHMAASRGGQRQGRARFGAEDMESEQGDHDEEVEPSPAAETQAGATGSAEAESCVVSPIPKIVTHALWWLRGRCQTALGKVPNFLRGYYSAQVEVQ